MQKCEETCRREANHIFHRLSEMSASVLRSDVDGQNTVSLGRPCCDGSSTRQMCHNTARTLSDACCRLNCTGNRNTGGQPAHSKRTGKHSCESTAEDSNALIRSTSAGGVLRHTSRRWRKPRRTCVSSLHASNLSANAASNLEAPGRGTIS